jgi:dihydrofolate reductase
VTDKVRIAFAVAVAENGVIGAGGDLPWRLPTDLKRFRKTTMGKPIVMGRKTYVSIGKPLDGRDNIVITRDRSFSAAGIHVVFAIDAAIALGRRLAVQRGVDEVVVIGGAEIFHATLASADRIYLTLVRGQPAGDTFLDPFDPTVWTETAREPMPQGTDDQYPADFIVLERKR